MLDFTNNDTKNLMRLLTKFNLVQLIKSPTRITATTNTVIDHIITNRPASVSKSGVLSCGISDHNAVFMIKRTRLPKLKAPPKHFNVRNYEKFDLKAQHVLQLLQILLLIISLRINQRLCSRVESCPVVSVIMMLFS